MLMIRKKVKVYFIGPMAENMKADGKTVNSTELVHTHQRQVKQNKVNGKMEKDYIGSPVIIVKNEIYDYSISLVLINFLIVCSVDHLILFKIQ